MGMYTRFYLSCELSTETSYNTIIMLEFMIGIKPHYLKIPKHILFETGRWKYMLRSSTYYADTNSLKYNYEYNTWFLNISSYFKCYDDEINKFLNWINPNITAPDNEFIGYYQFEEDETITPIYFKRLTKNGTRIPQH